MYQENKVVIVGAGSAGLATSACLNLKNIPNIVLEKEDCCASLWKRRAYDRLKLHLAKEFCELPHMKFPPNSTTFVPRQDFVQYLDEYASHFNVNALYTREVQCASFDQGRMKWIISANNVLSGVTETYVSEYLVVASDENSEGYIPPLEGLSSFTGEVMHSSHYNSGKRFDDENVSVVGSGNSGMEIAYDLFNWSAKTSIVVRSPVRPSIDKISEDVVYFTNGDKRSFDVIVFATGYKSTVQKWIKEDFGFFNENGMPKAPNPNHWKGKNSLYCAGFGRTGLFGISNDAKAIAADITC